MYHTFPGRLPALQARFRDHTVTIFNRHHMTSIGYWVPQDSPQKDSTLIYIISHESRDAAKKNWAEFIADPEWQQVAKASEADGKIVEKIDSTYMDRHRGSTPEDAANTDIAIDEDLTAFDLERLLLDDAGAVVGMTAVIDSQELTLSGGKLPPFYSLLFSASSETSKMEPSFEEDKKNILPAAKCTSCLLIQEGELDGKMKRRYLGTAFFVTDHLLLTAWHNIVGVNGTESALQLRVSSESNRAK